MNKKFLNQAVATLRAQGFAVVVFTPEELGKTQSEALESELEKIGSRILNTDALHPVDDSEPDILDRGDFDGND